MLGNCRKAFLLGLFLCIKNSCAHVADISDYDGKVAFVVECTKAIEQSGVSDSQVNVARDKCLSDSKSNEEDLLSFCEQLTPYLSHLNENQIKGLTKVKDEIIDYLRSFHATSYFIEIDPNVAFILDHQTPSFTVYYENGKGKFKQRKYDAKIWSIGFKVEFAIRLEIIKIISGSFNYYDSNKEICLGKGIEVSFDPGVGVSVLYCGLEDFDGGMLIVGVPIGLSGALSMVIGGSLVPVKD
jgi:hypothetical protein